MSVWTKYHVNPFWDFLQKTIHIKQTMVALEEKLDTQVIVYVCLGGDQRCGSRCN